jgi:hypothetical protein
LSSAGQVVHSNVTSLQIAGQQSHTAETASTVLAAQARAVIEARYLIALNRPRDLDIVREKLMKECRRPGFAEVAIYKKPIGKGVEGLSIRFAEAAIRYMGNIDISQQTIYDDAEKRIIRVSCTDMETNTPYSSDVTIEKTVERRSTKDGDTIIRKRKNSRGDDLYIILATEDDILNKQNALMSKAIRTNGLRLVPGDIQDECEQLVRETKRNSDVQDPDRAKRRLFDAMGAIGVTVAQIKEYLGHDGETLQAKELEDLRGIYVAIKDGEANWREVMDHIAASRKPAAQPQAQPTDGKPAAESSLKDKLRDRAAKPNKSTSFEHGANEPATPTATVPTTERPKNG